MWSWLAFAFLLVAGAGCLYLCAAIVLVGRFSRQAVPAHAPSPSITILKPLHGSEPGLEENFLSFCSQDYPGAVQVVFGVQDPNDRAIPAVTRLIEARPRNAIELVVDGRRHGSNAKVSSLVNMAERVRHEVVVLADSDMRVGRDYLVRVAAELERPGVGGVTCLYHGIACDTLWSRLSTLAIDTHFLPNVIVGLSLGLAKPCFGSTIALRAATLAEIGGFKAFADVLADDYAIGASLRARGYAVAVPPFTIGHVCSEASWEDLWRHELRWARTIRGVDPAGYAGSAVTHPLPFALLATLMGGGIAGLGVAGLAIACRIGLCMRLETTFGLMPHPYWLLPFRDLLSFAAFVASFLGATVTWKGHDFRVTTEGNLISERRPPNP